MQKKKRWKGGNKHSCSRAGAPNDQLCTPPRHSLLGTPAFPESALAIRAVQSATYSDHSCGSPDCIASGSPCIAHGGLITRRASRPLSFVQVQQ